MTETQTNKLNLVELAKQGHPKAIALLLNRHLEPKKITVKSTLSKSCLKLMFEAEKKIPKAVLVDWLKVSLLQYVVSDSITEVIVYHKKIGQDFPDWQEEIVLNSLQDLSTTIPKATVEHSSSDGNTPSNADNLTESLSSKMMGFETLFNSLPTVTEQVKNTVAETVNNATTQAGQSVIETATQLQGSVQNLSNTVMQGGKQAFGNFFNRKESVKNTTQNTSEKSRAVVELLNNNPFSKSLLKNLNINKILEIIEQVDIEQVKTEAQRLRNQYPDESPNQISHRIMVAKVLDLGTSEIASKFVSERLSNLMGVDATSHQTLEFEMIYGIAYAYGLDLDDPIRKDEALTIFSLALGSSQALKLGLCLLGDVPLAGTIISVSSNAVILYALGYAACRFYESNFSQERKETTLEKVQIASQNYLEIAITQEAIMDQILVHLILARNPAQTWQEILPQLQNLALSIHSLEVISQTVHDPPPLNDLLGQLNRDFAMPTGGGYAIALLAKYQQMIPLDGVKTPQEEQIIKAIQEKSEN